MRLEQHLDDIRTRLQTRQYTNKAAVSQGIVIRLLQALGWPTYDTQIVCPEYAMKGGRVDFALCHPAEKPIALVEVKSVSYSDGTERELLESAFHVGAPMAILTDGQEWHFFLPAEQGDYRERRVYTVDIVECDISESMTRFKRYLSYSEVIAGRAIAAAREDYQNLSKERQILEALPLAWLKLVTEEEKQLLELIANKVTVLCGFTPELNTVARFLKKNLSLGVNTPDSMRADVLLRGESSNAVLQSSATSRKRYRLGFSLDNQFTSCSSGREVLVATFKALAAKDPTFLTRFAALPEHGKKRRYLAKTPEELYPGRPDLAQAHCAKVGSGWYVGTNVSRDRIRRIIERACDVAGIRFGKDLIIYLGNP